MTVIGSVTYSTGLPSFTGTSQTGGNGGGGSGATSSGSDGKHGLPTYVAAIIGVLGAFSLIALIVFGIRRRAVAKRAARKHWWASVVAPANSDRLSRDTSDATAGNVSSTRSIRSSFGTTFDHSEFSITFDDNVPSLPPMAEIRGGPSIVPKGDSSMSGNGQPLSPISPMSATSPVLPIPLLVSIENSNLFSDANRRSSTGSSASAQYLNYDRENGAANHQLLTPEASTPMSVRPFSPTESFAFPSPPREQRSSAWITAVTSPVPMITETLVPSPPPTVKYSENPFADAFSVPLSNRASAEFDAIETIWRPFEQTLQDEITVHAGDSVKVLAVYDDGWAMVERVGMGKGKGKASDGQASVGLIPIDCMRKAEESVSSFLAAKRVSSVDATGYAAMAV
ncbi:hypothetical protein B0H19DRAFT_1110133 [Mycena capillaripes]|nr:hypothetical protein B0H19DRAFT_1110133 [Mycena capillaripes]